MPSRRERQSRARIGDTIEQLKAALFGLTSKSAIESLERHGRLQHSRYGHFGLSYVTADRMPEAIDAIFARINLQPGQRLLEIGPGPHGGIGTIAALTGLHVVMVEQDVPFVIDIDLLKQQLSSAGGSEAALAQLAHMSGSIHVSQIENLKKMLIPHQRLIASAGGSCETLPGDFADATVQQSVRARGPFDHIICTDVIDPMKGSLGLTTAATTTGDAGKIDSILNGLADAAEKAKTLYSSVIIPEENEEFGKTIEAVYQTLEHALQTRGRSPRYERVISPSSSTVVRARLYQL